MPAINSLPPPPSSQSEAQKFLGATVAELAYMIYESRLRKNSPGSPEQDWKEAEDMYAVLRSSEELVENVHRLPELPEDLNPKQVYQFFRARRTSYIPRLSNAMVGISQHAGCSAAVMSLLTGEHPMYIKARQKKAGVPDEEIVSYLRSHNFEVTHLQENIIKPEIRVMTKFIRSTNVVLLKLSVAKDENSWGLLWGGVLIHNWEQGKVDEMTFVNHRIIETYLIWHPSWETDAQVMSKLKKAKPVDPAKYHEKTAENADAEYRDIGLAYAMFGTADGTTLAAAE